MTSEPDSELTQEIAADVMACLQRSKFFEQLDNLLCPEDQSAPVNQCGGDFSLSKSILEASAFDVTDISDILAVLRSRGACCDCEVLYNISEENRLKAKYWRSQVPSDKGPH